MYCVKCGVKLADTENKCPLCNTSVYHPEIIRESEKELYPIKKIPKSNSGRVFVCGAVLILFMIPLIVTFLSDIQFDGVLNWFWYVMGTLVLLYIIIALPLWFKHPNPVIFLPCDFFSCAIFLFYINILTNGSWFLTFALPIVAGFAIVTSSLVTLLKYLKKGKLYVVGGSIIAFGCLILMIEYLMKITFAIPLVGWSLYPFISLVFFGGLLIYLAMNSVAREKIERKIFF